MATTREWGVRTIYGSVPGASMRRVHLQSRTILVTLPAGGGAETLNGELVESVARAGEGLCAVTTAAGVRVWPFEAASVETLVGEIQSDHYRRLRMLEAVAARAEVYAERMHKAAVQELERQVSAAGGGQVSGDDERGAA